MPRERVRVEAEVTVGRVLACCRKLQRVQPVADARVLVLSVADPIATAAAAADTAAATAATAAVELGDLKWVHMKQLQLAGGGKLAFSNGRRSLICFFFCFVLFLYHGLEYEIREEKRSGVHNPPALPLIRRQLELGKHLSVHNSNVGNNAGVAGRGVAGRAADAHLILVVLDCRRLGRVPVGW